ncbi:MAG: hypothetical protein WCG36_02970 [bacterium]
MEKNNSTLILLWSLAGLSLATGLLLTLRSLNAIPRTTELWERKAEDIKALTVLQTRASRNRAILDRYSRYPAVPVSLESLTQTTLPGRTLITRATESRPCVPGWSLRKVSVDLNDIEGEDLGKWLAAGAQASPPWALVECTLTAASTPGRLARATLVMETVERTGL